jgi:hypothetical protein
MLQACVFVQMCWVPWKSLGAQRNSPMLFFGVGLSVLVYYFSGKGVPERRLKAYWDYDSLETILMQLFLAGLAEQSQVLVTNLYLNLCKLSKNTLSSILSALPKTQQAKPLASQAAAALLRISANGIRCLTYLFYTCSCFVWGFVWV